MYGYQFNSNLKYNGPDTQMLEFEIKISLFVLLSGVCLFC